MSVIYCGKVNRNGYYIKEADMNIYSIQELAYFIYNYPMLISNNFVSKNLIVYINRDLNMETLSNELNMMYNRKNENIINLLKVILKHSNYYTKEDIEKFTHNLIKLIDLDEISFINLAGDNLFRLKKYEKAIMQYKKIITKDLNALRKLSFCYAKMQYFDKAIIYLNNLYAQTNDENDLKQLYFCYKLTNNIEGFEKYKKYVDENTIINWDIIMIKKICNAKKTEEKKEIDELFLMGEKYIKENLEIRINIWKEKYRYIS